MWNIISGDATSGSVRVAMCQTAQNFQSDQVTKIEVLGRTKIFSFSHDWDGTFLKVIRICFYFREQKKNL